ncbi:MAG: glycosyltransferase, partial [Acidobacteriota bacterium]|nr:glycosyltransferase [Acidobacteriota bacterium]
MASCLYVGPRLDAVRVVSHAGLDATTERHRIEIPLAPLTCAQPFDELNRLGDLSGVIIEMEQGWPGQSHLRFAKKVLATGKRAWLYWPAEDAVECVNRDRLASYWRLWTFFAGIRMWRRAVRGYGQARNLAALPRRVYRSMIGKYDAPPPPVPEDLAATYADRSRRAIETLLRDADPVPFSAGRPLPDVRYKVPGTGVYLRTDFWAQITSGGSYGHTCYVAKELAAVTEQFACFMGTRFQMLDDLGLNQIVMPPASESSNETDLLGAHWFYYLQLKLAFRALRPAYIYERICMGNFCGAALSRELGIPYIVEYNGSEISMTKSFGGVGLTYEDVFIKAEDAAFRQATIITVVSQVLKDSLVERGIDADKILVNPNGADPEVYTPAEPSAKHALRAELGFAPTDRVIGFTGTFGGWHGIDVLAEAIPLICGRASTARFLLIGDGTHKHLLDASVATHGLIGRVKSMGRVPQQEGARLLGACDLFVSPHNSHMVDSKFFGSPTKLFEYMAVGEGIVGSDLEQLGEVLSPALRISELAKPSVIVDRERAVLCVPGDVQEFSDAVVALVEQPAIAAALGRNARQAVLDSFSWQRHVENVWRFLAGERAPAAIRSTASPSAVATP